MKLHVKIDKKSYKIWYSEIEEHKLRQKSHIFVNIKVSNKLLFGKQDFKYFIGYRDSGKSRPLCLFPPQMIVYERNFDQKKRIYVKIKKKKFLLNIWEFWKI